MVLESFSRFPPLHGKEFSGFLSPRNLALKVFVCGCYFRKLLSVMECQAMKQVVLVFCNIAFFRKASLNHMFKGYREYILGLWHLLYFMHLLSVLSLVLNSSFCKMQEDYLQGLCFSLSLPMSAVAL